MVQVYGNLDLVEGGGNQLLNTRVQPTAGTPATPAGTGHLIWDTVDEEMKVWDGSAWVQVGGGPDYTQLYANRYLYSITEGNATGIDFTLDNASPSAVLNSIPVLSPLDVTRDLTYDGTDWVTIMYSQIWGEFFLDSSVTPWGPTFSGVLQSRFIANSVVTWLPPYVIGPTNPDGFPLSCFTNINNQGAGTTDPLYLTWIRDDGGRIYHGPDPYASFWTVGGVGSSMLTFYGPAPNIGLMYYYDTALDNLELMILNPQAGLSYTIFNFTCSFERVFLGNNTFV